MATPEPSSSAKSRTQAAAIAAEHERLRDLLQQVQATADLPQLLPLLHALRKELVEHFATEEAADGLESIVREAPHQLTKLNEIFEEHKAFLDCVDDVTRRTGECLESREAIRKDIENLVRELHEHEVKETELMEDVVYDEQGGGD